MKRLNFVVHDEMYKRLVYLKERTEATSLSEVFRDALRIYARVLDETEKGNDGRAMRSTLSEKVIVEELPRQLGEVASILAADKALGSKTHLRGNAVEAQKNKKVVHLGTIVDDLDAPTWQRKKEGNDEVETATMNKPGVPFSSNQDDDKYDIPTFLRGSKPRV